MFQYVKNKSILNISWVICIYLNNWAFLLFGDNYNFGSFHIFKEYESQECL